jgi:D-glycero-alpha-D-manno-heptose-7-phosphate kinase
MRRAVDQGFDILAGGKPLARFGELLHESWMMKRGLDAGISNSTIDDLYDAGMEAGALGGKLLGAGGGGFLLFFVPPEKRAAVQQRLSHLAEVDFQVNAPGSHVVHCGSDRPFPSITPRPRAVRGAA